MFLTAFLRPTARQVFEVGRNFSKVITASANIVDKDTAIPKKDFDEFLEETNEEFMKQFPGIVSDLTSNKNYIPSDFAERFTRLLQYTVPSDRKLRSLITIITYKMLERPGNLTAENVRLANILGWCMELQESSLLIVDDILDGSSYRLNAPCWYKIEDVGNLAALDAIILENSFQILLKKYFSSHPFYVPIVELFINTNLMAAIGQRLDTRHTLDQITMERFTTIAKYKTGYYGLSPITLGMYLSKAFTEKLHRECIPVMFELSNFFQIKNDYFDCFEDLTATGKDGTDIQEGRCSWMTARALQKVNSSQRKIMEKHFGRPEEKSVKTVLTLYKELNLREEFAACERQSFEKICTQIAQVTNVPLRNLLQILVEKLYRRSKVQSLLSSV